MLSRCGRLVLRNACAMQACSQGSVLGAHEQILLGSSASAAATHRLSSLAASVSQSSSSEQSRGTPSLWPLLAALPFALAAPAVLADKDGEAAAAGNDGLLGIENRRRIFFKYEKRIRDNSTLAKSFDYFSSVEQDGQKFMLPRGLLASLIPTYPASQSRLERAGCLDGERPVSQEASEEIANSYAAKSIFDKFDLNGDGLMSYGEFMLVLTLLSIPESDVAVIFSVFDADNSGSVDADEFALIIDELQAMASVERTSQDKRKENAAGLMVSLFGPNLKGLLTLPAFLTFLRKLHEDVVELEFLHYDVTHSGTVPGIDFARSLVASSNVCAVDVLLDKADRMPENLAKHELTRAEFSSMHNLCRKKHPLIVALRFSEKVGRKVKKQDLFKIVKQHGGVQFSQKILDIIFEILGDEEGNLDIQAFIDILNRRDSMYNKEKANSDRNLSVVGSIMSFFGR